MTTTKILRTRRGRQLVISLLLVALSTVSHAYQPTVAPAPGLSGKSIQPRLPFFPPAPFGVPPPPSLDLSSSLISQLAVMALKIRLAGHTDVSCDVTANSPDLLLSGRVGPVTVKGKGWQSSKGLTCRAIEATVDNCQLDVGRILSKRKLTLTKPVQGKAMIALNSVDFANFIAHPLMKPPALSGQKVAFVDTHRTNIDATTGAVTFYAQCGGDSDGARWKCMLQRAVSRDSSSDQQQQQQQQQQPKARITVQLDNDGDTANVSNADNIAKELTQALTNFFNQMVFELDGTFLSFRDMKVTDRGESPCVMFALNIDVHKFPSRGLEF